MLRREAGTLAYCQSFSTKLFSFLEARAGLFNERCAGDVLVWKRWQQRGWRHYPTINLQLSGGRDFWSSCVRLRFRPDTSESIYRRGSNLRGCGARAHLRADLSCGHMERDITDD